MKRVDLTVVELDEWQARALTDRIRETAGQLWSLLAEAHDQRAWAALGYASFKAYVETEFDMSRRRAYQLIDKARVVAAISEAAGVQHVAHDLTAREVDEIKPHLDLVVQNVEDATTDTEPELKAEAARAAIEETRRHIREISKPDLGNGVSHPARYGDDILDVLARHLEPGWRVLDPFAGTGKVHMLRELADVDTVGVEIEPEWASLHPETIVASALDLPFRDGDFDAIVTSPTYGNRLADHHEASDPESRRSYRHDLGRALSPDNSGQLHWGPKYQAFHQQAWREALRVLRPGGAFLLNIKDHIREGRPQPVTGWHIGTLCRLGLMPLWHVQLEQPGLRHGANSDARVDHESIVVFIKEEQWVVAGTATPVKLS